MRLNPDDHRHLLREISSALAYRAGELQTATRPLQSIVCVSKKLGVFARRGNEVEELCQCGDGAKIFTGAIHPHAPAPLGTLRGVARTLARAQE